MKRSGIISLLSDFGNRDGYVAAMKGVILGINPAARMIDLSHEVEPQDVPGGAFLLAHHTKFFPSGTVHLAVVDPGVGSRRRLLAVETSEQIYVAPDNGLLDFCLDLEAARAVEITERKWWHQPICPTFHGRDILAPVAAHASMNLPLDELGKYTDLERRWPKLECIVRTDEISGRIVYVDRFGNLVANVPASSLGSLGDLRELEISLENRVIGSLHTAYADVAKGVAVAIIGGFDLLEIGINCGNAAHCLGADVGSQVVVRKNG